MKQNIALLPTLLFRAPAPHVTITDDAENAVRTGFLQNGDIDYDIKFEAVEDYPVSASWAELAIIGGSFASGVVAAHYLEKILDGFDSFVLKSIAHLNLGIRINERVLLYRDVPLRDREEAKRILRDVFYEISVAIERPNVVFYNFETTTILEDKTIQFTTTNWQDGWEQGGSLMQFTLDSPEYPFWKWLLRDCNLRQKLSDREVEHFRQTFLSALTAANKNEA